MGIHLRLVNHDEVFRTIPITPIILNDLRASNEEERNAIKNKIITEYSGDLLSNLAACDCGAINGNNNVGIVCRSCGTAVSERSFQDLIPIVWIRRPNGVSRLINPNIYSMLIKKFTRNRFSVIKHFTEPSYSARKAVNIPKDLEAILNLGYKRGYNSFVDNFWEIIEHLFSIKTFKVKGVEVDPLYRLLKTQPDCIFSDYIPIPNKALFVIENTAVGTFTDSSIVGAVDAIHTITGIDSSDDVSTQRVKENRTIRSIELLAEYYKDFVRTHVASDNGICRKHIAGARCDFSFRTVISSLTGPHRYDEIHIPWDIGVPLLRFHLFNKLRALKYSVNECFTLLDQYNKQYHPLLDQLFKECIAETEGGLGIPCIFLRNPTMPRGSIQLMYITVVKTAIEDPTTGFPILSVKAPNADRELCCLIVQLLVLSISNGGIVSL